MKKCLFLLISLTCLFATSGCGKMEEPEGPEVQVRWIIDWGPVELYIEAFDKDGKSIISPDMPGMSLTFQGTTYTVEEFVEPYGKPRTKYYHARLLGLLARKYEDSEGNEFYRLYFGQIDGAEDMDEDIVLKWPDGSKDTIHYHCSDHTSRPPIECNRWLKLNGVSHEGCTFTFTNKSL